MAIAVPDELQESVGPGTVRPCVAVRSPSGKSSRERMCPGAMSGGVRGARWTQIDAIARADVPLRHLEWRLPCQMNCRKGGQRPCTAVCGSSASFRQIIARADVPWSAVWRGPRPDDLPESERPGSAPAATLSQCSVAARVCLSWNKDFQLPRRYN